MKDQLYFRVFTTNRSIWRRKMAKWQLYKYHPNREFVWIGQTGQKIIRVCMKFCNFCKVPIWTIFHRKLLNLVGQLFIHQHFSFNVQIFNLINIRNSRQSPHVSAMGYSKSSKMLIYNHSILLIYFRVLLIRFLSYWLQRQFDLNLNCFLGVDQLCTRSRYYCFE